MPLLPRPSGNVREQELKLLRGERAHYSGHGERRLGGLRAAIVFSVQTARACLFFVFQEQNFVNYGDSVAKLDLHESATYGVTDLGSMNRLAAKDYAETNDSLKR
jgi:hypothetical protein